MKSESVLRKETPMELREQVARALCLSAGADADSDVALAAMMEAARVVLAITEADKAATVEAERAHISGWLRQGNDTGMGNAYYIGRDLADELDAGCDREPPDDEVTAERKGQP